MHGAADLIRAIASLWPLIVVLAVIVFRKPLSGYAARLATQLRSLKVGPVEATFWREAYEVRVSLDAAESTAQLPAPDPSSLTERLERSATAVPVTAIEEAYGELLDALREKVITASPASIGVLPTSASGLVRRAVELGAVRASVAPAVEGLTSLRNLAVHRGASTPDAAREFLALTDATISAIRQSPLPPLNPRG